MRPLQITAYLAGSIALARPDDLSLDGLLSSQILRRHFGEEFYSLPDPRESLHFARLPLEMRGDPSPAVQHLQTGTKWIVPAEDILDRSLWYWSCSRAQIEVRGRDTQYWNKRFDTQASLSDHLDFGGRREKIIIEQGRYKAYHMPLPTLVCDKVAWYAYGDAEQLYDLLSPIAAIGKKRAYGNGAVLRWEVAEVTQDWSEWRDGCLMRPIPGPLARSFVEQGVFDIEYIAFRAPQWHPVNQCLCVTRGVRHA